MKSLLLQGSVFGAVLLISTCHASQDSRLFSKTPQTSNGILPYSGLLDGRGTRIILPRITSKMHNNQNDIDYTREIKPFIDFLRRYKFNDNDRELNLDTQKYILEKVLPKNNLKNIAPFTNRNAIPRNDIFSDDLVKRCDKLSGNCSGLGPQNPSVPGAGHGQVILPPNEIEEDEDDVSKESKSNDEETNIKDKLWSAYKQWWLILLKGNNDKKY